MKHLEYKIFNILEQPIEKIGYELTGCEYIVQGGYALLRIYIDSDKGIGLGDCQKVMKFVNPLLDVEDIIRGKYNLEVSSPGENRILFTLDHYKKYIGENIKVRLKELKNGRRNCKGRLVKVDGQDITIEVDQHKFSFAFEDVEKANLIFIANS
jgi:ribosome maturation factor RimP